jgi:hypothetical protein
MANRAILWLTRSYNHIDKDPEIDVLRTAWQKEGITETQLAVLAGLANSTVHNMFGGKTVRPAHSTCGKIAGAMGYSYNLVRIGNTPKYETLIPVAIEQRRVYRAMLAKKHAPKKRRKTNGK